MSSTEIFSSLIYGTSTVVPALFSIVAVPATLNKYCYPNAVVTAV
jgi:hypothetical protein